MNIQEYFEAIEREVKKAYIIASSAKKKSADPDTDVDIPLAKNIFERVEGLIGAVKPEVVGSGIAKRLEELDKEYGSGDWRVALKIGEEVAREKFCKFKDEKESIEVGIRIALAYITMGVVSAPLEGFIEFKIKDRIDGKKYGSCYFAGPIRAAGGTAAAVTLLIADYLRIKFNIEPFDITPEEIERAKIEIDSYHSGVARLQYFPPNQEIELLLKNLPVEINGDPTSEREVLIHKDLPRVGTPRIRGGMCLVLCEGLAQKAAKILKNVNKWGDEFGLSHWKFLKEYIELKEKLHSAGKEKQEKKITPNDIYIQETVAGRPIFSYPMTKGGFRLRYGRSRLTGLAAAGIHPATTRVLGDFIATGCQLRIERPGKACITTPCSSIEGPVVKLLDESVIQINSEEDAIKHKNRIKEILFLGDLLFAYGEFARNNHVLVPSPYVEEWWMQEAKKAGATISELEKEDPETLIGVSIKYNVPLHPKLIFFYSDVSSKEISLFQEFLKNSNISPDCSQIIIPHDKFAKKILEDLCVPHALSDEGIVIKDYGAKGLLYAFGFLPDKEWKSLPDSKEMSPLELLNSVSKIKIKDKSGIYVGARMGRPEKAKPRKMVGRPHMLFPVASQGGRMRSLNEALEKGFIETKCPVFFCSKCNTRNHFPKCTDCGERISPLTFCFKCGKETEYSSHCGTKTVFYVNQKIDVRGVVNNALKKLDTPLPSLVKGVRGTSNKMRIPEPIEKGILRAINGVHVNKDGTVRYDAIETPITHFKPIEIGTDIKKLIELGYTHDVSGNPLENDEQILEIFPQDIILPDCKEWAEASAVETIYKTANFVDELLEKYYGESRYYNISSPRDMIGTMVIGLAPHTSAGMVGRVIGFSKTQGFFAHPYYHSAMRRNCDGDEAAIMLLMDALLNFSRQYLPDSRGSRHMDAPLVLTTRLVPEEVDDEVFNMDICDLYPLEFYEATEKWSSPYDVKIKKIKDVLGKPEQYKGMMFTHPTYNINSGSRVSAYKTLTSVAEKVKHQMYLAEKIRAVKKSDVAKIIIEKHFLKDIKGNLRKYSKQEFRCVKCNKKFRRIPLTAKCHDCGGKLILTVSEGNVSKYLVPSMELADKYSLPDYLKQTLELLKRRVESVFGKEKTKQTGLTGFMGG